MVSSLLITLREGLEAALLIGLLLAMLARGNAERSSRWVWFGVGAAAVTSIAAGAALFATGETLEGASEAAFEAAAMLTAAGVLGWMIVWVSRQAAALRGAIGVKVAAAAGSAAALFWLAFVLVVREGLETALFLFAAVGEDRSLAALSGGLAGLALAAGFGYAVYKGGSRIDVRAFFAVLNLLLLAFGAYLVWRGLGELGELAAGGEAGELAGPVGAVAYAAIMLWLASRRRSTDAAAAS
jgi:high-affinity iron transporter